MAPDMTDEKLVEFYQRRIEIKRLQSQADALGIEIPDLKASIIYMQQDLTSKENDHAAIQARLQDFYAGDDSRDMTGSTSRLTRPTPVSSSMHES